MAAVSTLGPQRRDVAPQSYGLGGGGGRPRAAGGGRALAGGAVRQSVRGVRRPRQRPWLPPVPGRAGRARAAAAPVLCRTPIRCDHRCGTAIQLPLLPQVECRRSLQEAARRRLLRAEHPACGGSSASPARCGPHPGRQHKVARMRARAPAASNLARPAACAGSARAAERAAPGLGALRNGRRGRAGGASAGVPRSAGFRAERVAQGCCPVGRLTARARPRRRG